MRQWPRSRRAGFDEPWVGMSGGKACHKQYNWADDSLIMFEVAPVSSFSGIG